MRYVVIRRSTVVNDKIKLPRPKIVQEIMGIGTKEECDELLEELSRKYEYRSTEDIEVELYVTKYNKQKSGTSARPGNGGGKAFKTNDFRPQPEDLEN